MELKINKKYSLGYNGFSNGYYIIDKSDCNRRILSYASVSSLIDNFNTNLKLKGLSEDEMKIFKNSMRKYLTKVEDLSEKVKEKIVNNVEGDVRISLGVENIFTKRVYNKKDKRNKYVIYKPLHRTLKGEKVVEDDPIAYPSTLLGAISLNLMEGINKEGEFTIGEFEEKFTKFENFSIAIIKIGDKHE